jgi:DNA-binding MarR family transcriptional regulator
VLRVAIRLRRDGAPARCPRAAGGHTEAVVASNVGRLIVDEKSMRLLTAMRQQLGETSASRSVDAVAAANSLGMYPGTLDRSLHELVQAGYIEHSADHAMTTQGMYRITFEGIAATDNT